MGSSYNQDANVVDVVDVQAKEPVPNAAICYLFGILVPLLYLSSAKLRRSSADLRFHCFQCLLLWCVWMPSFFVHVKAVEPFLTVLSLLCAVAWVTAMVQAARGKMFRIPGIGSLAKRLADG